MDEEEWEIRKILSVTLGHKISDQVRCAPSNNIRERMIIIIDDVSVPDRWKISRGGQ